MESLFIAENNRHGPEIETVSMAMAETVLYCGLQKGTESSRSHLLVMHRHNLVAI